MNKPYHIAYIKIMGKDGFPKSYEVKTKSPKLRQGQQVEIRYDEDFDWEKVTIVGVNGGIKEDTYDAFYIPEGLEINDTDRDILKLSFFGPSGSGKTYLCQILTRILDIPFVITDAT